MTKFTKNDLKTGMVVETYTGDRYMVLKGDIVTKIYNKQELLFIGENGFLPGSNFYDTLHQNIDNNLYNIIKVYAPNVSGFTSTLQACNESNLLWEYAEVDWSKVPVDAKIWVKDNRDEMWEKRHFAKYRNGEVYAFFGGETSWTTSSVRNWNYAKLAEKED